MLIHRSVNIDMTEQEQSLLQKNPPEKSPHLHYCSPEQQTKSAVISRVWPDVLDRISRKKNNLVTDLNVKHLWPDTTIKPAIEMLFVATIIFFTSFPDPTGTF